MRNSPADVFITVDVGRLWRRPAGRRIRAGQSAVLESRIPAQYRDPDGNWFGFSARARVIAYNKAAVKPGEIKSYEDLADPKWKGKVCTRSSGHVYSLSLISSLIANTGEPEPSHGRGASSRTSRAIRREATPIS